MATILLIINPSDISDIIILLIELWGGCCRRETASLMRFAKSVANAKIERDYYRASTGREEMAKLTR